MFKYILRLLFVLFFLLPGQVYCQAGNDSSVSDKDTVSVQKDSSVPTSDSSLIRDAEVTYLSNDSLYLPVNDSLYLNMFARREVPASKVDKYLTDPDYAYANDPGYWKKDKTERNTNRFSFWEFLRNKTFQWIIFLVVIAGIIYGVLLLAKENNFRWFSRNSKPGTPAEPDTAESGPVDYNEAIRKYQLEDNYRLAVRYLFLRLIHSAAEKNIIRIGDSTTNLEIRQAFGRHPLKAEFRYLATAYEYIYFGNFGLNKEIFESLKTKFDLFQEKLSA